MISVIRKVRTASKNPTTTPPENRARRPEALDASSLAFAAISSGVRPDFASTHSRAAPTFGTRRRSSSPET